MTAFLLKWSAAVAIVLGLMMLGAEWEAGDRAVASSNSRLTNTGKD